MNRQPQRMIQTLPMLALLLLAGCAADDRQMAADFFSSFFKERYATPLNVASYAVGASTGDAEADAALGAADTVRRIKETDTLAAQADAATANGEFERAKTNLTHAVAIRPNDVFLQIKLAGAQFRCSGDAEGSFEKIENIMCNQGGKYRQQIAYASAVIEEVRNARDDLHKRRRGDTTTGDKVEQSSAKVLHSMYNIRAIGYNAIGEFEKGRRDDKMSVSFDDISPSLIPLSNQ